MRPEAIDGWMSKGALSWLYRQSMASKVVVEVGAWKGRSTKALALRCPGTVYAVDTWAGVPDDPEQNDRLYPDREASWDVFSRNLAQEIKRRRVVPLRMESTQAAQYMLDKGIAPDFVFIDADHRYEAVVQDIKAWGAVLRKGGILAGHDYWPSWPEVIRAVDELVPDRQLVTGGIWWTQR